MSGYCGLKLKAMLGHSYFHWTTNMKYTVELQGDFEVS